MRFNTIAAASVLAALSNAQTFTDCNPIEKECPNDPAMPQTWETDFTAGKDAVKGWKQTAGSLTYGSEGAEFIVAKKGDAPTIGSTSYLHFGYVEVTMKAAPGQGIISSIVLQSDDLDEVDWEWIGGQEGKVQMNYFGKGNTTTYDRMIEAPIATTQSQFHKYALNWTAEALTWLIDDQPVRTLKYGDANGGRTYPQTPCNVRLGNWPGGDSDNEGTREWAGGNVSYANAPFTMTVKSIKVTNYSPGKEYKWTDKTGDYKSIEVIGAGDSEGAPQNTVVIEPSATVSAAPLASNVDAPTATGNAGGNYNPSNPAKSTSCTEGATHVTTPVSGPSVHSTGAPVKGGESNFPYPGPSPIPHTSGAPNSPPAEETPCECGTATVTVTAAPPPATNAPPAVFTSEYSAAPQSSIVTPGSSVRTTIVTSIVPVLTPIASAPPYPTSGIAIDTHSPPAVPTPSAPSGVLPPVPRPSSNGTASAPPAQFTGAASHTKVSALVGVVAGVLLLTF